MGLGDIIFDNIDTILKELVDYYDDDEDFKTCPTIKKIIENQLELVYYLDHRRNDDSMDFSPEAVEERNIRREELIQEIIDDILITH